MGDIREEVEAILEDFAWYNNVEGRVVGKTYAFAQLEKVFEQKEGK